MAPPKLDRLQFFPSIRAAIPDLLTDILNKNPDDLAFQDLVDDATIRFLMACFFHLGCGRFEYTYCHIIFHLYVFI